MGVVAIQGRTKLLLVLVLLGILVLDLLEELGIHHTLPNPGPSQEHILQAQDTLRAVEDILKLVEVIPKVVAYILKALLLILCIPKVTFLLDQLVDSSILTHKVLYILQPLFKGYLIVVLK